MSNRVRMSDFEIQEQLGNGAYAPVFKVRRRSDNKPFAMKRLVKHNYVRRSKFQASLPRRERDTLRLAGKHPNVASLCCAFDTDTFWVLVIEFCAGGTLESYLKRMGAPGLSLDIATRLNTQVLLGLRHLHHCNILHRDLKPDNIGIGGPNPPVAKLIDFGFAKRADSKQSRTIVGSYGYVAPEIDNARHIYGALRQIGLHGSSYDHRADLYSFGIILFVSLVGKEAVWEGDIWTHTQFRAMLEEENNYLWSCRAYRRSGIQGSEVHQRLRNCSAFYTISLLTETLPDHRPRTAEDTALLPFFPHAGGFRGAPRCRGCPGW